ncbi:hypothetical protein R1sor_002638 [Riccia sorocarpa]|uniref:Uncharacterized protein n=1 Tax=Riccia sorocarpa TaxID=122646 RepID=A0ABD3H1H2_9MARC
MPLKSIGELDLSAKDTHDPNTYCVLMDLEDVAYVVAGGPAILNRAVSPASSSSSSNSEMKLRAMARLVEAQKNAARHRMTKQAYEMIVSYLENPNHFAAIPGGGRETRIAGKTWTKMTAFGHMAVTLFDQGFPACIGIVMGKKYKRYVETYKKACNFSKSTGSGLNDEEVMAGLTLEQKMNSKCHYFFRMHALLGGRANIKPPAVGDAGLPVDMVLDVRVLCQDSQPAFSHPAADPLLSEDEEETVDREEEPIDLSEDDEVDNQTAPVAYGNEFYQIAMPDETGVDKFYQTARADEDDGPEMGNQTARSALDVEAHRERLRIFAITTFQRKSAHLTAEPIGSFTSTAVKFYALGLTPTNL